MEPLPSINKEGYYIPHHAVLKESSLTTKLRVVFDASAKSKTGVSLNQSLMVGPTIQDGLFELILRFRIHLFAFSADVEKMYRQFLIHPEDRKFQRILWRYSRNEPLQTYELNTVTYGTASAPYLATSCLKQLSEDEMESFPRAATVLTEDFYVDDLFTGADRFEEAKQLGDDLMRLTGSAGLRLCKWMSNDPRLIEDVDDRSDGLQQRLCEDPITKALGIVWNARQDTLNLDVDLDSEATKITKRSILSKIARLNDALGFESPVIVFAKILMQGLWKLNLEWDELVPENTAAEWNHYQSGLSQIKEWNVPRSIRTLGHRELQLHGFSDASQRAYGAVIYIRSSSDLEHQSTLLCSKSRVAPVKTISLPRLELCAAVLLAKLYKTVLSALKLRFQKTTFWSDSSIVLSWIRTEPYKLAVFEANRIAEIQGITKSEDWKYISTKENPADAISRGQLPNDFLNNQLWKEGPVWLSQSETAWPNPQFTAVEIPVKQSSIVLSNVIINGWDLWKRYSSLRRLTRVVAYCLRFLRTLRERIRPVEPLTVEEIQDALKRVIEAVQREEFSEELYSLMNNKELPKSSRILRLNPVIENGLLKVGGRIKNSDLDHNQIHPIILPKTHPLTTLIARETHLKMMHAGTNSTLYAIRQIYWIVDGRSVIKRIIYNCVKCTRAKPKELTYQMGDLPKIRITAALPFENCGVDYCGHFYVKEKKHHNRGKVKVYAAVFVCLVTKAIHIELVSDLTTESFIGSLRRFFARRGKSKTMYSDNGTNFVGANNELKGLHDFLNSKEHNEKIQTFLADQQIEWKFIPPRTPHFGGIWEAAVRSLKHHMRRTLGDTLFTFEELATYMSEIKAILNSRPLTPLSSDPNDLLALTPGHFLIGRSLLTVPACDFSATPVNRLSALQHIQKLKLDFWKRWHREYLTELNVRSKWYVNDKEMKNVKIGALVVIRDDNLPPLRWSLGRIVEIVPGDDGIIRVVKLKTEAGIIERGLKKVSLLPFEIIN